MHLGKGYEGVTNSFINFS